MPKQATKSKKPGKSEKSITSENRLETMLTEAEGELSRIQPQIEKLEKQVEKLAQLKLTKQKLITLKLSLKSIIENFSDTDVSAVIPVNTSQELSQMMTGPILSNQLRASQEASLLFLPDLAFSEVDRVLQKRTSLNYEIFRAIVFNGGEASTEQIKQYLVDNKITQPTSGESFASVELTDISSRANYLVRKGVVETTGRGRFKSKFGWTDQID